MLNLNSRADLIEEVRQLREDLTYLNKVVTSNRRLIAFLEYTRSSAAWTYVPGPGGSFKGEALNSNLHGVHGNACSAFQVYPYKLLAAHVLRTGGQL